MDTATHAIVGLIVGECAPADVKHRRKIGLGFGMLPDLTNIIFVHPYLGWVAERTIPFAVPRDFLTHPEVLDHWTYHSWLLTHSLLFSALVFLPWWRQGKTKSRPWPMPLISWPTFLHTAASTASSRSIRFASSSQDGLTRGWPPAPIIASIVVALLAYVAVRQMRERILWPSNESLSIRRGHSSSDKVFVLGSMRRDTIAPTSATFVVRPMVS